MEYVMNEFLVLFLLLYVLPFAFCMIFSWIIQVYCIHNNDSELLADCELAFEDAVVPVINWALVIFIILGIVYIIFNTILNLPSIINSEKNKK